MRAITILAFLAASVAAPVAADAGGGLAPTPPAEAAPGQYNPCNPKLRKCD